jgi:hypothetical protein
MPGVESNEKELFYRLLLSQKPSEQLTKELSHWMEWGLSSNVRYREPTISVQVSELILIELTTNKYF